MKRIIEWLREQSLANIFVFAFIILSATMVYVFATSLVPALFDSVTLPRRGVRFRNVVDEQTTYPLTTEYLQCSLSIPDRVVRSYKLDGEPNPRYVVDVEETESVHSPCEYPTHEAVNRVQVDWLARLVDPNTGEVVAEQAFDGYVPYADACPEWVTIENPNIGAFYGCPDNEEFENWVLGNARNRPAVTPTPAE